MPFLLTASLVPLLRPRALPLGTGAACRGALDIPEVQRGTHHVVAAPDGQPFTLHLAFPFKFLLQEGRN